MSIASKDLVALVADKHQEATLLGLLARPESLPIRPITCQIYVDSGNDPGCRTRGPEFLRNFARQFHRAFLMFDHAGCGAEQTPANELEESLQTRLDAAGWSERSAVVVLDPETEVWVWSPSRQVDAALGWSGRTPSLRQWLVDEGLAASVDAKPQDPKAAFHRALRRSGKKPSAAIFRQLADTVSFQHCQDRAFRKLRSCLQTWFPIQSESEPGTPE